MAARGTECRGDRRPELATQLGTWNSNKRLGPRHDRRQRTGQHHGGELVQLEREVSNQPVGMQCSPPIGLALSGHLAALDHVRQRPRPRPERRSHQIRPSPNRRGCTHSGVRFAQQRPGTVSSVIGVGAKLTFKTLACRSLDGRSDQCQQQPQAKGARDGVILHMTGVEPLRVPGDQPRCFDHRSIASTAPSRRASDHTRGSGERLRPVPGQSTWGERGIMYCSRPPPTRGEWEVPK